MKSHGIHKELESNRKVRVFRNCNGKISKLCTVTLSLRKQSCTSNLLSHLPDNFKEFKKVSRNESGQLLVTLCVGN